MTRALLALAAATLLATPAFAKKGKKDKKGKSSGRELSMSAGTMQLGGSATLDVLSAGGNTSVGVNLNPTAGYFVADSVEIFGGLGLNMFGGVTTWGVEFGGKYFIDVKPNWIYVGLGAGYGSTAVNVLGNTGNVSAFAVAPQGGLLVPLGKNVGLDVGTKINVAMAGGSTVISVPLGFLGVQAFFP